VFHAIRGSASVRGADLSGSERKGHHRDTLRPASCAETGRSAFRRVFISPNGVPLVLRPFGAGKRTSAAIALALVGPLPPSYTARTANCAADPPRRLATNAYQRADCHANPLFANNHFSCPPVSAALRGDGYAERKQKSQTDSTERCPRN
jgi:hypothetical protein